MQSLSKYNKGIKYLLCAIDLFSKYAWVVPIKHKKELVLFTLLPLGWHKVPVQLLISCPRGNFWHFS